MRSTFAEDIQYRMIRKDEFDRLKKLFPDDEETWKKYRAECMRRLANREMDIFVIETGTGIIGEVTVHYVSHELQSETIPGRRVYLGAYRLEPTYRGRGLGQKLLDYVLKMMEARGYTEFTIGVEEDNEIAKHIYFKYGFVKPIDHGYGDEFDPSEYTLYLRERDS
ncbi:MAG: GNAT family N-acetyltransferase [Clostridium sp.]|nr:GNAT family N-acetyltransferase [Clostridium sp.]